MKRRTNGKQQSLLGKEVMVHPFLTNDPYNSRGKIGVVKRVHNQEHLFSDLTVEFPDKQIGFYQADAIYTLYPEKLIRQSMYSAASVIGPEDRKVIKEVLVLLKSGHTKSALLKAMAAEKAQQFCCCNGQQWLELSANKTTKRKNAFRKKN